MRGKLIVFEGTDSSGKRTQVNLLEQRLRADGRKIETMSFPSYSKTKLGDLVGRYLSGEFGTKEDVGPEVGSMFFMMDRYQFKNSIKGILESGNTLLMDRYTTSNIFQAAEMEGDERFRVWEWIKSVDSRLPKPDVVVFLNVDPKISDRLFAARDVKNVHIGKGSQDMLERDKTYQEKVRLLYLEIARKEDWIIIECCKGGMMRKPDEIHEEIHRRLKERNIL
ncbi:MAG: thymidylate kinase [Candidatus Aenigmatarchaeota archaeon]